MKKLLIAVAALIALVIVAAIAAPFLIPVSVYKDQIEARAQAATGRALAIKGGMSLALFPSVAIEAKDVSFANAQGASTPQMAQLKSLKVAVKLMPLLRGRLEIDSFVLEEPVIVLEIDRQGRGNWVFGTQPAAASTPSASAPSGAPGDIRLGEVRLKDGRVTYIDARSNTKEELTAINATLDLPDLDKPMKLDGGATWHGKALTVKLDVDKPRALMAGQLAGISLQLGGDPIKLSFKGQATTTGRAQGDVDLAIPSVKDLATWVGSPINARPNTMGALAISGKIERQGAKSSFTGAKVSLDQLKGSGDIIVDTAAAKPHLTAKLAVEKLDINPYLPPEAPAQRSGSAGTQGGQQGWSEDPIDLSPFRAANADLDLTVGGLVIRKIEIGKGVIKGQLRDGKLTLDLTELALYQGSGQARVVLDGSGQVPAVEARLTLAGVQAEPILKAAAEFERLTGTFGTESQVTARGRSQKEMVSALAGQGKAAFTDGAIKGINLAAMVRNITSAFTDSSARETQKTDFSELGGTYTIQQGIVRNNDFALKSPLLRVEGKGTVDLPKKSLDYRVEPKAVMSTEGQGGQMQAFGIMVPVDIKGPWDNLSYRPDLAALIRVDPSRALDTLKGAIPAIPGVPLPGAASQPAQPPAAGQQQQAPASQNPLGTLRNLLNR
ncbi:MAG: AsmA family protein [Alphaproteobacteria bacterium]|nr:AsmA family protein [Alphaproteobacteria bacterium]